jgi:hypothetical protein
MMMMLAAVVQVPHPPEQLLLVAQPTAPCKEQQ